MGELARGQRERLPKRRASKTYELEYDGQKIYVGVGIYPDGRVGELFVNTQKNGSMMRTSLGSWAMAVSKALQFGMPLKEAIHTFRHTRCNESIAQCEDVPGVHGQKYRSSWDVIAALLEAETDSEGKIK